MEVISGMNNTPFLGITANYLNIELYYVHLRFFN